MLGFTTVMCARFLAIKASCIMIKRFVEIRGGNSKAAKDLVGNAAGGLATSSTFQSSGVAKLRLSL